VFERRGFVAVDIAALSVSDQMALMANVQQIAGEVGSFSMNALFAPPGLGVITVAAGSGPNRKPYLPGAKSYTRAVTDFGQHHQRRIVASPEIMKVGWIADIALVERALDSMPDIPSR
jgi:capsular polysaccharide biosynthesis protein